MKKAKDIFDPFFVLRPFSLKDLIYYFGRTYQIKVILNKISNELFIGITGPSGSGKSISDQCRNYSAGRIQLLKGFTDNRSV